MNDEVNNPVNPNQENPAQTATPPANQPAADPAAAGEQKPAEAAPAPAGKTYTDAELDALKTKWQQEYEQAKTEEKDFAKMTPEQQTKKLLDDQKAETAKLQADLADRDLTDYARGKIADAKLPSDALPFIKGKDNADTDAKIKAFSALLAAGIQAGVEARFKQNGYTPRGSAAGNTEGDGKKARGVTINEKK